MKAQARNLTQGNTALLLCQFALPILLGQILQSLYNSADAVVVGNFCGATALAAVSVCSDVSRLLVGFFTGLSIGTGVLIARCYGAREYQKMRDSIHTALLLSFLLGTAMAVLGVLCAGHLLQFTDCPADVYPQALEYLRIYLIGVLFTALYNVGAGILRAVGDSRTPLYYLAFTCIVNIAADLVAVWGLKLGVSGAAIATIISQLGSMLLLFRSLMRTEDVYRVKLSELRIHPHLMLEITRLGIPAALQNSLNAVSQLFVQKYINDFQTYAIAGIGAAKKIDRFAGLAATSIGNATTMFVSQNLGAKKPAQAVKSIHVSLAITICFSACVSIPSFFFAPSLVRIFTDQEAAIYFGTGMIRTMMPMYFLQGVSHIYASGIRGFGHSRAIMFLNLFSLIAVKQIFLAVSLSIRRDVRFIYWCYPLSWAVATILNLLYYQLVIKKQLRQGAS